MGGHRHGWHRWGTQLILGGLLLGALIIGLTPAGNAQNPKSKEKEKEKSKAPPVKVTPPPPLNLTLASKDKDVADAVNFINEKLEAGWKANKIVQSRWCDDHEFIRRASLDIIGRIATPDEIATFFKDPAASRRSLLIDRLLAHPEYAMHWADIWTNWLLTRSGVFGQGQYHEEMAKWLKDQFALNRPYDQIVRDLLTATGKNSDNGAVNFLLAHVGMNVPAPRRNEDGEFEMVPVTSRITRLFLGTQVQCAQCHDHPFFTSIKQRHFWGVNAFLRQVEREGNLPMRRQDSLQPLTLKDNPNVNVKAEVFYEKRNGVVLITKAEFLPNPGEERGQKLSPTAQGLQRRVELANFLLDHDQFPRAIVNRMWGVFMGRGFTNPVDDFNDQNAPSNPELLTELAARFKNYNFNLQKLIRWICNSNAYQLSVVANPTNDKQEQEAHFSRMLMKTMTPEQMFESLMVATNAKAAENSDDKKKLRKEWLSRLVANFGDDEGNEVSFNGTVVQALLMMNGEDLNSAITRKDKGTVALALARGGRIPSNVINELYLAALNRKATAKEISFILREGFPLNRGVRDKDYAAPYQDLFWALLNSNEFMLNH